MWLILFIIIYPIQIQRTFFSTLTSSRRVLIIMSDTKQNIYKVVGPNGILVENYSTATTKIDTAHYMWIINHYSFHDAKGDDLHSPIFSAATNTKFKWSLLLEPKNEENENFVGLHLCLERDSECEVGFGKFELSILGNQQKKIHCRSDTPTIHKFDIADKNQWGYPHFISKNNLTKVLMDDKLIIYAEVTFSDPESYIDTSDEPIFNQFEQRVLKDDLSADLEQSYKSQDFTDVVILVNRKRFRAHKYILTIRSPVFAAMFKHDMKENKTNEIKIRDIDENVFEEMLYYMYTGKFKNLDTLACDLLGVADKYGMEGMKAKCENALLKNLSVENATNTLILADLYRASELKSRTISFIVMRSTEVMETETWKKIVPSHPHLINEVCGALSRQLLLR